MESIWTRDGAMAKRPRLTNNIKTQVAVIGAGMAGILTAYTLQEAGKSVVVLEADRIAGGQTRNTTAKITAQHGLIYHKLFRRFGAAPIPDNADAGLSAGAESARLPAATLYARANQEAVEEYRRIIREEDIACDFREAYSCIYSDDEETLKEEERAAAAAGLSVSCMAHIPLPVSCAGGVRMEGQAQFHPLKFIRAISEKLTVYEHTPVRTVEGNLLVTDHGRVEADSVVFACHYPFINFPGLYFARMHQERSYVLALANAVSLEGMFLGEGDNSCSFRSYGEILLFGGENHRTGENRKGDCYRLLREKAHEYFPLSREVGHWSAQDCMTPDSVPYIGRYAQSRPGWYVATGFQKWGMTSSMVSALLIRDLICRNRNPYAGLFAPSRVSLKDLPAIAHEGMHAVKALTRRSLYVPRETVKDLPPGHGGVVRLNGAKAGVYKEEDGTLYAVDIRCPHLGCELSWNPDERTWDCPCHGSRFDYKGKLLNNPAQEDLAHE